MAIAGPTVGAAVKIGSGTGSSLTPDFTAAPSGALLHFALGLSDVQILQPSPPTGWALVAETTEGLTGGSSSRVMVFTKVDAGDTTVAFTWGVACRAIGVPFWYTGTESTEGGIGLAHTSGTSFPTGTVTPTAADRWIAMIAVARDTSNKLSLFTPDAAMTEAFDDVSGTGSAPWVMLQVADTQAAVTQAGHTYTSVFATSTSHGGVVAWALIPTATGTTPVGKDMALQWDTRAALGDTVQAIWDVRAAVSDTVQALWDVRQAIGDPVALQWDTRALVTKSVQALWDVRQAIGDPVQLVWDTRALATKSVQALWDIRVAVGDPVQLVWDVQSALTAVGKDLGLQWDTRAAIGDPLQAIWDTRAAVSRSTELLWDVRSVVADELALIWATRTAIGDAIQALWDVRVTSGKPLALLWNIDAAPYIPARRVTVKARPVASDATTGARGGSATGQSVSSTASDATTGARGGSATGRSVSSTARSDDGGNGA